MFFLMKIPQNKHRKLFFSKNCRKEEHPLVYFKNIPDTKNTVLKHIGLYIDENFNYNTCIKVMLSRVYKGIGLLRNFFNKFPKQALVTIYNAFIRPHVDYDDIVYYKPNNETCINKFEKVQYDAVLAINGEMRGTSREKLFAEIGIKI